MGLRDITIKASRKNIVAIATIYNIASEIIATAISINMVKVVADAINLAFQHAVLGAIAQILAMRPSFDISMYSRRSPISTY
jgi:hypothetical protein